MVKGHSFHHFLYLSLTQKTSFYKNGSVWYAIWESLKKSENSYLIGSQRTSFTKVVQFGMLFENVIWKVKVMLSFGTRMNKDRSRETKVDSDRQDGPL